MGGAPYRLMDKQVYLEVFESGDLLSTRRVLNDLIDSQDAKIYEFFLKKGQIDADGVPKPHKDSGLAGGGGAAKRSKLYAFLVLVATAPAETKRPKALEIPNIHKLNLTKMKFPELPEEIGLLSELTELKLHFCGLSDLPDSFSQLTKIQACGLEGNKFKVLPRAVCSWQHLKHLSLDQLPLQSLPPEIKQLIGLESLYIRGCKIKQLPSEIGELPRLERLTLINLPLKALPDSIGALTNFKKLDVSDCAALTKLPPSLWDLPNLEVLHLTLPLKTIPLQIKQLQKLRTLTIDNPELSQVPAEIGQLASLESLTLKNLTVQELPKELGNLQSLQSLYIENGSFDHLPETWSALSKLRVLWITSTPLTSLFSLGGLSLLETLYLYDVPISERPDTTGLAKLREVTLEHTNIP